MRERILLMNNYQHQFQSCLGQKLKEARMDHDISLEDAADTLALPKKVLSKIEAGAMEPEDDMLSAMINLYHINKDSLLFEVFQQDNTTYEQSSFSFRLKEIMEYRKMTTSQLSSTTGILITDLDRYLENQQRFPTTEHLKILSNILNVAKGWLLGYAIDIHPEPVTSKEYSDIVINHGINAVYPQEEELGLLMAYWQCMGEHHRKQLLDKAEELLDDIIKP